MSEENTKFTDVSRRTLLKGGAVVGSAALLGQTIPTATAQAATLRAEIEGRLQAVDRSGSTITVMGATVDVSGASFASPTASLSLGHLDGAPLPGRGTTSGFIGGTAIVLGSTPDTGGVVTADEVFVEVAENVLVGAVTANGVQGQSIDSGGTLEVQGVQVQPIGDSRMPTEVHLEGLAVDVSTIPVGSLMAVEGHLGDDGVLYVHTVEASAGQAIEQFATSITRLQCDSELEVRGASTTAPETVTLFNDDTGAQLATTAVIADPETGIATYRFRVDVDSCPETVRVENTNGSNAVASVSGNLPPAEEPPTENPPPPEPPVEEPPVEDPPAEPVPQTLLTIEGTGSPAVYRLSVSGVLEHSTEFGGSVQANDVIAVDGRSASGRVVGGRDSYLYSGDVELLEVDGAEVNVYVNSAGPVDRGQFLPNLLTIEGTGQVATYAFTVGGDIVKSTANGASIDSFDGVKGGEVLGRVIGGRDSYAFSGDLSNFRVTGDVNAILNGSPLTL